MDPRIAPTLLWSLPAAAGWLLSACDAEGALPGPGDDDVAPPCDDAAVLFDFEDGEQGFVHLATDPGFADPWSLGDPAQTDCHSGISCWATALAGVYGDCEAGQVRSPPLDLSACAADGRDVFLSFWHFYRFEEADDGRLWDGGLVQFSGDGGDTWQDVEPLPAYEGPIEGNWSECQGVPQIDGHLAWSEAIPGDAWTRVEIKVPAALLAGDFLARFVFGSDRSVTAEGWFVDDVAIEVGE